MWPYFNNALELPLESVNAICRTLDNPNFGHVDFIVGMGISGTLLLTPVSIKSGIPFCVIRKAIDHEKSYYQGGSHSKNKIETGLKYFYDSRIDDEIYRYVIIDDFVCSGDTLGTIIKIMTDAKANSECVGIILYNTSYLPKNDRSWGKIPRACLSRDIREDVSV